MNHLIIAKSKATGIVYKFINSSTGIVLRLGSIDCGYKVGDIIENLRPPTPSNFIFIKEPITFKEL